MVFDAFGPHEALPQKPGCSFRALITTMAIMPGILALLTVGVGWERGFSRRVQAGIYKVLDGENVVTKLVELANNRGQFKLYLLDCRLRVIRNPGAAAR